MDPLSALSTAAAVVQFVDFGYRLIKSAHELYTSPEGQKAEYIVLSTVSHDLSTLTDAVKATIGENAGPRGEVLRLCRQCVSTNDELQAMLDKLKARGDTKLALAADTWRVALRQVTAAGGIDKLANRLSQIRQQMNVALLYLLLDEAGKSGVELREFAKQQADMIATLDRVDSTTKQFSTDMIGLIDKLPVDNQSEVDEMVRYVLSDKWDATEYAKRTQLDNNKDRDKVDKVCQNLYFESISHREAGIPKRHATTFEWIFQEPRTSEDGLPLWVSFSQWLQGDSQDIYWITGKPGAGKSTLVKFFAQDPRLEQLLQRWADGSQLLVARFFSWTSGANRLQRSHEGLFRTLLLETIRQRSQLAVDIFPARWFLLQSFNGNVKLPALTMDELVVGFRNLLHVTGENLKLVLLIDGLDEFDDDHDQLVQILREANEATGVKICASSRPWNTFKDAYGKGPMLRVENLTQEDIKSFVQEKLELSPGYHEFAATNPQVARKIITDIVNKSQGVFLWVAVISGLLERDFREGASITDLQDAVDRLPSEIADLFRYIWDRTGKRFRAEASQFFQVMNTSKEHDMPLGALTLWFGGREVPVDLDATEVTNQYLTGAINFLERKLMSRTGGLLELVSSGGGQGDPANDCNGHPEMHRYLSHVEFMHRTANDWVRKNWASITSATDPDFNPGCLIVKGKALSIVLVGIPPNAIVPGPTGGTLLLKVLRIASRIPENHPDKGILAIALDRLDHIHVVNNEPLYEHALGFVRPKSRRLPEHLHLIYFTHMVDIAPLIPIPLYLKEKVHQDVSFLSNTHRYERTLHNVIFGEIWFSGNTEARLQLVDLLTQTKYRTLLSQVDRTKGTTAHLKTLIDLWVPWIDNINTYWIPVLRTLESCIAQESQIAQDGRDGASPESMSERRKGFRVSVRKFFSRK